MVQGSEWMGLSEDEIQTQSSRQDKLIFPDSSGLCLKETQWGIQIHF